MNQPLSQDQDDPSGGELLVEQLPEWAVPLVQYSMLVLCLVMGFGFVWLGGALSRPIGQGWGWGVIGCFVASFILGYGVWKARVGTALIGMVGKGLFRVLWRLLLQVLFRKNSEADRTLVDRVEQAMPGEEQGHAFASAFRKASRSFWIVSIPFSLLALIFVVLGGGGALGGAGMMLACLAYGVSISWLARKGLFPLI